VSRGATDLFSDREGDLWVTTTRGVSKIAAWQFASYGQLHGLLEDEVSAVCERRPGSIVLGHNSGLTLMEGGTFRPIPFAGLEGGTNVSRRVLDLHADTDGSVWIAAEKMGLGHLSADNRIRWSGTEAGLVLPVASVTRDRDGTLWVSSDLFLYRLTADGFREQPWPYSGEVLARRIQARAEGGLYLSTTTAGLVVMDREGRFSEPTRDPKMTVLGAYAALDTHDGRTLVGTSRGLLELREGRLERPPEPGLGVTDPAYLLAEDDVGALWIGTDRGAVRWNGTAATVYTPARGLAGWETNRAAALLDSRNQLWIGTDGGVSVYRRWLERDAIVPPLVRLGEITANDRPVTGAGAVELGHAANTLDFAFGAVSFLDERSIQYRYRLAGFESAWSVAPAHVRAARYTNLPPGRYAFELEACNAVGVWSETVSSPAITIRRPVWARWWFFVGTTAAGVGLLLLGSAVVLRFRYATRLRDEVAERTDQLRESEARYRQLFDSAANPKLLVATSGTIVDANAPACEITGCDREQLLGSSALSSPIEWIREAAERSALTSEGSFLVTSGDARGEVRDMEVWTTPVDLGGRRMLVVSAQDVTERRRLQEEHMRASKLESVRVLAAGVAHDFNNILTAVLGNISLTQMRLDGPAEVRRLLDRAEQALLRAKHLTTQLLTFTREVEPVRRMVDVGHLVREAATLMLSGSASTCTLDTAQDLWPAEVDEGQITQVVGNLVLNADQAMPEGGTVTVRTENASVAPGESETLAPGPYVKITVADHGVGIPQELQERVFDPYFTTKETGSGLGLATTYAVVTRHRGAITLSSNPGAGASFHVWLPASPGAEVETLTAPGERPRQTARILVMDDEEPLRELYVDMLTALGYEADAVPDGRAAIERYTDAHDAGTPYQVVIMDLTVPGGMGGEETMCELRRIDPDVRAVVASGYLTDSVLANPVEVGFRARLNKPFTITELTETLDEVLRETPPS